MPGRGRPVDHPRSRGEYQQIGEDRCDPLGSSPLSRGILDHDTLTRSAAADHPRSRGEYTNPVAGLRIVGGSSPLSRGILLRGRTPGRRRRIIPALAGNTCQMADPAAVPADHPRSRGEYSGRPRDSRGHRGSSPLSRGILAGVDEDQPVVRIIPALAGNTDCRLAGSTCMGDHPRSRGEYPTYGRGSLGSPGSSPLSRGIPFSPSFSSFTRVDHPRSRGEYYRSSSRVTTTSGSSPLSRGIRRRSRGRVDVVRIIPALAGNTPSTC